ncbi:MAG: excinuclease ABC subunit C, partial [Clostridia bacterium]|nr:excinuclease ABC subunit C [Clostridia bacterium]
DEIADIVSSYMTQYYTTADDIPHEIIVEALPEFCDEIKTWLTAKRGAAVNIHCPQRGEKKQLLLLAKKNAVEKLNSEMDKRNPHTDLLKDVLGLKNQPNRIEGFDISHLQGTNTVSSMVVFEDGKPKKSDYRHFKIKSVMGTIDDFRSMKETLTRRFEHMGDDDFGKKPDLILIDGGKGQLRFAYEAMQELGIEGIEMISLAEKNEEIYTIDSNEPIVLPKDNKALQLLQRVRDEAHRFAITYNKLLREKTSLISIVEDVPGVGPKKRRALMEKFRTVGDIRRATVEELCEVEGINLALAEKIKDYMGE